MTGKKMINVGIQVLPLVPGAHPIIGDAIKTIQSSGVKYEVGPLETTIEGDDLDRLLEVAKSAHRACFKEGVSEVVTFIKIAQSIHGTTIEEKVSKYRSNRA